VKLSNARFVYEPNRGDGALCVYFKDKKEAVGFAEAILQEVQNIESGALSFSECPLVTIDFGEERRKEPLEAFSEDEDVLISVPDIAAILTDGDKEI
jgi:hypothetical protein